MQYEIPESELRLQLVRQVRFIQRSSESYDGFEDEAARIAVNVRVLVHDTRRSVSLLKHLGVKEKIPYLDTAPETEDDPSMLSPDSGLTMTQLATGVGAKYQPICYATTPPVAPDWVKFETWWNKPVIVIPDRGLVFSRSKLILSVANQDGGAHVDTKIDADYAALSRFNAFGWTFKTNSSPVPAPDIFKPSIRQIAYEIIETLRKALPRFVSRT